MDVLIVVGSKSDIDFIRNTTSVLDDFKISYELRITSAHRTPNETKAIIEAAEQNGAKIIIAAAGYAAHLPGVCAAFTQLPVIGVPVDNSPMQGADSLHSIVMMPAGVPVACMTIGKAGAKNAAYFAAKILSLSNDDVKEKLNQFKEEMREKVLESDRSKEI